MKKKLLLCTVLLAACSAASEKNISGVYQSPLGYSISAPAGFSHSEKASSGYFYFGYPDGLPSGLKTIEIRDVDSDCSPSITGASQSIAIGNPNDKAEWGKIDFWNHGMDYQPGTEPLCRPAGGPNGAGYALCSEKDGKTVVICISQMTDNPQLAEDIFKTFKWTK